MNRWLRDPLFIVMVTAIVNGLVTWGVVQTKLDYLDRGVIEAKQQAALANARVDQLIMRGSP